MTPCIRSDPYIITIDLRACSLQLNRFRDKDNMGSKDLGLVTFYSNRLYYAASRLRFSLRSN